MCIYTNVLLNLLSRTLCTRGEMRLLIALHLSVPGSCLQAVGKSSMF
jgi:hypothetical protein